MKSENNLNPNKGSLWKTPKNQERLVLYVGESEVAFATRGENAMNKFESGQKSSISKFLDCSTMVSCAVSRAILSEAETTLAEWLKKQKIL